MSKSSEQVGAKVSKLSWQVYKNIEKHRQAVLEFCVKARSAKEIDAIKNYNFDNMTTKYNIKR